MFLLCCLEAEQNSMETTSGAQQSTATEPSNVPVEPPTKKRAPSCRKCHQPMRGHPRNNCPVPTATQETTNNWLLWTCHIFFPKTGLRIMYNFYSSMVHSYQKQLNHHCLPHTGNSQYFCCYRMSWMQILFLKCCGCFSLCNFVKNCLHTCKW